MKSLAVLLVAFLGLLTPSAVAQSYSFTVFAGLPPPTGTQDGTGTNARFNTPIGLGLDGSGNLYVADRNNSTVRKITPAGVVTTFAGLGGVAGADDGTGTAARFNQPIGLALDGAGNVYVTDRADHTVRKITPAGVVSTLAGLAGSPGATDATGTAARFRNPNGIAVDTQGNVYVADTGNRTIRKITSAGVVSTLAGSAGLGGNTDGTGSAARFNAVGGLTIDGSGNLYVVDSASHVIRKITSAGVVTTIAGTVGSAGDANGVGAAARFNTPHGIVSDSGGTLYVADTVNETIRQVAPDGTVTVFAGSPIAGNINGVGTAARFFRPQGMARDAAGNIYVADTFNHSIRKLTSSASSSTFAGAGGNFGSADGTGPNALFNRPRGIGTDRQGNVYVSESFNNTVRKITPTGIVSTFAGQAGSIGYVDATGSTARFGYPYSIALDSSDNIFVVDLIYNALRRITPAGAVGTWAGTPSTTGGSSEGAINTGRFNQPQGVAVDGDGNTYVADAGNHSIRKVSPAGVISTLAGLSGTSGSADGTGNAARFSSPGALAVDAAGNVFVADYGNSTIRKITPAGVVTTFAGLAGNAGSSDGAGSAARFDNPDGVAIDGAGNLFVSDSNNHTIRRITPDGNVTTIGGLATVSGVAGGPGSAARFFIPSGITVDATGVLYVVSAYGNVVMRGAVDASPVFTVHPLSQTVFAGTAVTFTANATGGGVSYQWKFNNSAIPGATGASYTIPSASAANAGSYTVEATNSAGSRTSNAATLTIAGPGAEPGRIINLALRSQAGTGAQTLIVGFATSGVGTSGTKALLLRGAGPALQEFNVSNPLADPRLQLYSNAGAKLDENDDWGGSAQLSTVASQVGAFPYKNVSSKDAAIYYPSLTPGTYSVWLIGNGGATGVGLAEIYDATPAGTFTASTPRLVNVSARTQVGINENILIAGFTIGGQTSKKVLIRGVGPTLAAFNVAGALANPKLELFSGQTRINDNDDWAGDPVLDATSKSVGAFDLPLGSTDAVLLVTLPPGGYTAQVSGVGGTTGIGLVEVYEVP